MGVDESGSIDPEGHSADGGAAGPAALGRRRRAGFDPIGDRLDRTRRRLPHWQLGGATYLLTYRCAPGRSLDVADRTIVLDNWRYWNARRYSLHAVVVMPDHVHVLLTPSRLDGAGFNPLAEILQTNKGFTAHRINARAGGVGPLWQQERYDRIVRDEDEFWEKWKYMLDNPVKAGLCLLPEGYPWWYGDAEGFLNGDVGPGVPPPA